MMAGWRGILTLAAALLSQSAGADSLPLGDGKVSNAPQRGHVFACSTRFDGGGAVRDGPWIRGATWDPAAKPIVGGAVPWPNAELGIALDGDRRVVRANNLPSHPTGVFPIRPDEPAYRYDRNPNAIRPQTVLLTLPAVPVPAAASSCLPMGPIGIALSGAAIFSALDAQGRDAPAHEIQDRCNGHPEPRGQYHYHDLSPCLDDHAGAAGRHSDLVGYALDGFGLYGRFGDDGKALTNADLDACHGHTHGVAWNGAPRAIYHYHVTREYPYTLGCFRGTVAQRPPGPPPGRPMSGPPGPPGRPPPGGPPPPPPFGPPR
jgi:hypothetical protein